MLTEVPSLCSTNLQTKGRTFAVKGKLKETSKSKEHRKPTAEIMKKKVERDQCQRRRHESQSDWGGNRGRESTSSVEEDEVVANGEDRLVLFMEGFHLPDTLSNLSSLQYQNNFHPLELSPLQKNKHLFGISCSQLPELNSCCYSC